MSTTLVPCFLATLGLLVMLQAWIRRRASAVSAAAALRRCSVWRWSAVGFGMSIRRVITAQPPQSWAVDLTIPGPSASL